MNRTLTRDQMLELQHKHAPDVQLVAEPKHWIGSFYMPKSRVAKALYGDYPESIVAPGKSPGVFLHELGHATPSKLRSALHPFYSVGGAGSAMMLFAPGKARLAGAALYAPTVAEEVRAWVAAKKYAKEHGIHIDAKYPALGLGSYMLPPVYAAVHALKRKGMRPLTAKGRKIAWATTGAVIGVQEALDYLQGRKAVRALRRAQENGGQFR